jgi:hypothetical protein
LKEEGAQLNTIPSFVRNVYFAPSLPPRPPLIDIKIQEGLHAISIA